MRVFCVALTLMFGTASLAAQFNQRPPSTPAETLLESVILRAMDEAEPASPAAVEVIAGSDAAAGEILISCHANNAGADNCAAARRTIRLLDSLINTNGLPRPARAIRLVSSPDSSGAPRPGTTAAIHVDLAAGEHALQVVRSPWSSASIVDEVVEVFARHGPYGTAPGAVQVGTYRNIGQPPWDAYGVPTVTLVGAGTAPTGIRHLTFVTAATAYFLATMPNSGAEALLSHLTVGAHARVAEDARRAVAQMGMTQRPSAEVLNIVATAIEREQRRIRSFANFMPSPIDPNLQSRLNDMEKGITGIWTSLALTSAPYTPLAQRIRGRGGEDRRVPSRVPDVKGSLEPGSDQVVSKAGPAARQLAILKMINSAEVIYEAVNFIDGKRSISDIRDAVSGEFGNVPLPPLVEYFELLARIGTIAIR